jgi:hypothetical protein
MCTLTETQHSGMGCSHFNFDFEFEYSEEGLFKNSCCLFLVLLLQSRLSWSYYELRSKARSTSNYSWSIPLSYFDKRLIVPCNESVVFYCCQMNLRFEFLSHLERCIMGYSKFDLDN